ncbi:MAG: hypothetical protein NC204_02810 [Candidatus Amulumruptor caecigallinarius]|nr:hypothetical protein [Candidatus Amulumruptor caecigallinarius]
MNLKEDNKNDYFDGPDIPENPIVEKKPVYKPDDPRYWDQPEDEFEHLRPSGRYSRKLWIWVGAVAVAVGIIWGVYLRYFSPYITQAAQYGYVEKISKHGDVFTTYEGIILPYKSLMDTTRAYEGDFEFSTSNPEIAARLKEMQFSNLPVRVIYSVYHTRMPWRGNTRYIITRVDSVNERDILPPDRQPATVKGNE